MSRLALKGIQAAAGAAAGEALYVEDVFSTYLYDGTATTNNIVNGVDLTEGGLVWFKTRDDVEDHNLVDSERGSNKGLESNTTDAETGSAGFSTFNSDGFTLTSGFGKTNSTSSTYASWTFRKAPKFFDVVTYTGDGTAGRTVSHNLGSVPGCMIIKNLSLARQWQVYHRSTGNAQELVLNSTDAAASTTTFLNSTDPTSTEFTLGTDINVNGSGYNYVAYLFAHNDGDGEFGEDADQDIIKCGSFTKTDTGFSNFVEVDIGFEVQWILIKRTDGSDGWEIFDIMRGMSLTSKNQLEADTSDAESTGDAIVYPTANGFAYRDNNDHSFIYIAIRRGPMKTPESGTEVFDVQTSSGVQTTGFPVDAFIGVNNRASLNSYDPFARTRLLGGATYLTTSSTAAQASGSDVGFDSNTGVTYSWSSSGVNWYFRRAPGFFDVVAYTGNGTAGRTVSHNLGSVPGMIIVKQYQAGEARPWSIYHIGTEASAPEDYRITFNPTTGRVDDSGQWNDTAPTSTVFTVGASTYVNNNGESYIAYLFASAPGVSKVGSYTGNGTSQTIDCGFSAGARFVLIRRVNTTGNWNVWDSERGIVAGNDPRLELNTTDAEDTGHDYIDPDSSGFIVNYVADDNDDSNVNGDTYIFLAIA